MYPIRIKHRWQSEKCSIRAPTTFQSSLFREHGLDQLTTQSFLDSPRDEIEPVFCGHWLGHGRVSQMGRTSRRESRLHEQPWERFWTVIASFKHYRTAEENTENTGNTTMPLGKQSPGKFTAVGRVSIQKRFFTNVQSAVRLRPRECIAHYIPTRKSLDSNTTLAPAVVIHIHSG